MDEVEELYKKTCERNPRLIILSYPEYKRRMTVENYAKDPKCKCGVYGCQKEGLYEGGDSRCWVPMCEEHAELKKKYIQELKSMSKFVVRGEFGGYY